MVVEGFCLRLLACRRRGVKPVTTIEIERLGIVAEEEKSAGIEENPDEEAADEAAESEKEEEKIQRLLSGNPPQRVVYVPGRLINIVV